MAKATMTDSLLCSSVYDSQQLFGTPLSGWDEPRPGNDGNEFFFWTLALEITFILTI